jgi:hypothetical protein
MASDLVKNSGHPTYAGHELVAQLWPRKGKGFWANGQGLYPIDGV